ncbi:cytochrome c oxidase subunit II [Natronomonas salina]|nr:cytochrome c oxidase subunit II [Natronomonas salina]
MMGSLILSHQVPEEWRAQAEVFSEIFWVFLVIGTLVGVVVVGYTLYHAYRGRDTAAKADDGFEPPVLGELPTGQSGAKSRKLFVSFGISAVIVISLVAYSYFLLLYVEEGPTHDVEGDSAEQLEVQVVGVQFSWQFVYPNGVQTYDELRVPQGEVIRLTVTSNDVWHNFGIPELRVKADSIPGQEQETWFLADETGNYTANCYELCGQGHSDMVGEVIVMENEAFYEWYESQASENSSDDSGAGNSTSDGSEAGNSTSDNSTANASGGESTPEGTETGSTPGGESNGSNTTGRQPAVRPAEVAAV